ncbi:hypothetical protein SAMN05661080_01644 [Modestobacter sp. DSM 44400]|uniref:hypothetical protein n=1 Tax=Modestobacter sp. DSM 44400 TaxID=1550230 RepID=UPI000896F1EA|nr:hypothetical protein [Modestobacter sp. DSM 44400]SDX90454.1 hypothetical protein SAMN05661080_01644 [Modestobacter sp. DSM 44400]
MQAAWRVQACARTGAAVTTSLLGECIDRSLQELCEKFTALNLPAAITVEMLWGYPDVRLQVRQAARADVAVELLAPDPPAWSSQNWDAVRIEEGHREVWRGPDRSCPLTEVTRFVQALLCLGAVQLAQLYTDLG